MEQALKFSEIIHRGEMCSMVPGLQWVLNKKKKKFSYDNDYSWLMFMFLRSVSCQPRRIQILATGREAKGEGCRRSECWGETPYVTLTGQDLGVQEQFRKWGAWRDQNMNYVPGLGVKAGDATGVRRNRTCPRMGRILSCVLRVIFLPVLKLALQSPPSK